MFGRRREPPPRIDGSRDDRHGGAKDVNPDRRPCTGCCLVDDPRRLQHGAAGAAIGGVRRRGSPAAPPMAAPAALAVPPDATVVDSEQSVSDLIDDLAGGDPVVVLEAGSYPPITITGGGPLTIVGRSRDDVKVAGIVLDGAHDVTISGLTIAGNDDPDSDAVRITGGSQAVHLTDVTIDPSHNAGIEIIGGSRDVTVDHSLITGAHVTRKLGRARNIHIGAGSPDRAQWVEGIRIENNELVGAGADAIQVAGAPT